MLDSLLATLDPRSEQIVRLYYQHDLTQTEIGRQLGYSQMHVSRLLRQAIAQLAGVAQREALRRPRTHGRWSHCRRASATWPSAGGRPL